MRLGHRSSTVVVAILALTAVVGTVSGCDNDHFNYGRAAQEELTSRYSCPKDRVTVSPRPDLKAFDLMMEPGKPPAEVAADPGRLKVWREKQDELEAGYNNAKVMEAKGCDHHVFYSCFIAEGSNQSQVIACREAEHPPGK